MAYDALGNYTGYDDSSYQDFLAQQEEERKRREEEQRKQEEEAAGQVVHKQEIETRADGSKTISTTADLPPAPPAPTGVPERVPTGPVVVPVEPQPQLSAGAGRGFVNPQTVQPVNPQVNQSQGFDQAAYNANIAQAESGSNPNIGYHDIKTGTAYGPYGITAIAWKDARASDPSLPQDITRATPEQMVQAQNQFTDNNARYLKNYGVEVTPNTLSAAHFLGARGLRDYLRDGTISPQTAANNGGEDKVREIVQARLGGQPAPASGAVTSPVAPPAITAANTLSPGEQVVPPAQPATQPQPQSPYSLSTGQTGLGLQAPSAPAPRSDQAHVDQYQAIQDKPMDLLKFGTDPSTPQFLADRARNRAADLLTQDKEMAKAKQEISTMTETDLAKKLREKTSGGSYFKLFMYGLLGMENSGRAEAEKLGLGGKDQAILGPDNKPYLVTIGANGTPREGYNATTGAKLTPDELIKVAAGGQTKWQTNAEYFQDKAGNVYQSQHNDKGATRIVNVKTNEAYSGTAPLERLRDTSKLGQMAQAQEYRRENFNTATIEALKRKRGTDVLGALADLEKDSSTPLTEADRMAFIKQYGGYQLPAAPAQAAPAGTPTTAVVPSGNAQLAPVAPGTAVATGNIPTVAQPPAQVQPAPATTAAATTTSPNAGKPGYDANGIPVRLPTEGTNVYKQRVKDFEEQQKQQREIAAVGPKTEAKATAEDLAKIKSAQPKNETNADYLLTRLDTITNLPGFESSVGLKGPAYLFGLRDDAIPGTDAADWQAAFREIQGQQFLQAYQSLKGTGSISEKEGAKAEQAIARMNTSTSEKAFREATTDFQDVIRRAIDNDRKKLGQEPKYGTEPASAKQGNASLASGTTKVIPNGPNAGTYVYDGKNWRKQ